MIFPAPELISGPNTATAFLGLQWQEMFDASTPDTYQPRFTNTPSLIRELGEIAQRAMTNAKWSKHFTILQDELKSVSEAEQDLFGFDPYYRWVVAQFRGKPVAEIPALAAIASGYEAGYRVEAATQLRAAAATLPKTKVAAGRALKRWATIAIQQGCAEVELATLADTTSFKLPVAEWVERLIKAVDCQPVEFWCCLAVVGSNDDNQALARERGFEVVGRKRLDEDVKAEFRDRAWTLSGKFPDDEVTFVSKFETERDHFRAARKAIRSMRNAIDVCNFYSESPRSQILPIVLTRTKAGIYKIAEMTEHNFRKRFPRRARALTLTTMQEVPSETLGGRVLNALEHYNLAHFSSATRVKLVNLWTATECLAGSHHTIIEGVCDMVAPIVTWRRSDKILNYAATCLQEYRQAGNSTPLPAGLAHGATAISREQLLLILSKPKNHPDLLSLFAFAAGHPLLVHRLNELWQCFSEPQQLLRDLIQSQERVRWQLYRIYRSRNLIVHEGHDSHLTISLLDNMHYYFSITLSRILHGMQLMPGTTIDVSIAYWCSRYSYLWQSLQRDACRLLVRDMFANSRGRVSRQPIWHAAPAIAAPVVPPPVSAP